MLPRLEWLGLEQYDRLWSTRRWLVSIESPAMFGACSLVLTLTIGFVLAAMLDREIRFGRVPEDHPLSVRTVVHR